MTLSLVSPRQGMIMYRVALLSRNARRKRSELLELLIRFARGPFLRNTESQIVPMHKRIQDTGILSHIWETCVPNVYAFSLHEYKPGVHRNIYTHCTDGRCMRERRVSILHHDARTVIQDTRYVCARLQHTVNVRIGRFGIIRARERNIMQPPALSGLPGSCGMYHPFCPPILYNREKTRAAFVVVNTSPDY